MAQFEVSACPDYILDQFRNITIDTSHFELIGFTEHTLEVEVIEIDLDNSDDLPDYSVSPPQYVDFFGSHSNALQ